MNLWFLLNLIFGVSVGLLNMECFFLFFICFMDFSLWEWVGGKGVLIVLEWGFFCGDEYKVGLV